MPERKKAKPRPLVAVAEALPADTPTSEEQPPLEREQPHRALAKATAKHAKLTEELRKLRADWAAENIRSQQTRQAIATSRVTFVENRRRELHLALEATQAEIGRLGRQIREAKATRQSGKPRNGDAAQPKRMP